MGIITDLLQRVMSKADEPKESVDERLLRERIRRIHTPTILTPAEYRRSLQPLDDEEGY